MPETFTNLWRQLSSAGADEAIDARIEAFSDHCPNAVLANLLRAELRRRQGQLQSALDALADVSQALLDQALSEQPHIGALFLHTRGLLLREQGHFAAAAEAFIASFALDPSSLQSIHALQFTRLTTSEQRALHAAFHGAVEGSRPAPPLALLLLADWQQQLGDHALSCIGSYRAAQRSVTGTQAHWIDRLSPPDLPEALIIGAPKSGTTSLAGWLAHHPQIHVHPRKELHFFDNRWPWGADWYRCQFPRFRPDGPRIVRLEATPNYLQLAEVPQRVQTLMPQARLIVMLREPLQRALSWSQHIIRQEGVARTPADILSDELRWLSDGGADALATAGEWHATNCLAGSLYRSQLERWRCRFSDRQILVLPMERTIESPERAWKRITEFLEIETEPRGCPTTPAFPLLNAAPGANVTLAEDLLHQLQDALQEETEFWQTL
jgi:hypothetical protein